MPPMKDLLRLARRRQPELLRVLERLVRSESPSNNKAAVDRCGRLLAAEWRRRGARVEILRQKHRGDHLLVDTRLGLEKPQGQIFLLGHIDTVYDLGTLQLMPWRIAGGRAYGPGIFDMKSGLAIALFAVQILRELRMAPKKRVVCLWTSDEEIGSESSRKFIEREAKRSDAVLVLEPASGLDGRVKTARKGVGDAEIIVTGRAAHAGLNPEDGVNAVHELALQIERIMRLNDPERGTTVNVNVMEGGSRSNVIADRARAVVDLRATTMAEARALEKKLHALRPILPGAKLEIRGGIGRPPLERKVAAALLRHAQILADEMGMELGEAFVGGGSDGNFTAALGIPTLDGLGGIGEGAHAQHENIVIRALPARVALIAGLLATL
ncbi:MAG: M20 family metallopeptidase [Acidobacteria bacterium]|nr:M20 family metallopeptidase [Acidobacteriota bacterium]MBI3664035.1 M20 family metallopeptidase [Acidobacteriota bacterium]